MIKKSLFIAKWSEFFLASSIHLNLKSSFRGENSINVTAKKILLLEYGFVMWLFSLLKRDMNKEFKTILENEWSLSEPSGDTMLKKLLLIMTLAHGTYLTVSIINLISSNNFILLMLTFGNNYKYCINRNNIL